MMRRQFIKTLGSLAATCGMVPAATAKANRQSAVKPRHVICFLGEWGSLEPAAKIVDAFGNGFTLDREYSLTQADERMEQAFMISKDRVAPSFVDEDWKRIARHNTVAYVLSPPIEADKAVLVSTEALDLVARMIKGGATAVKSESAGNAHGLANWVELAQKHALREAWVRRPIEDEGTMYSCGMHLLGLPDVECAGRISDREAVKWIDAIADAAIAGRAVGSKFALNDHAPGKKVARVPCDRYADDDFFFNPYGYFRVSA